MSELVILVLIIFLILCLLVTIVGYVLYSGLLSDINIKTGSPPVKNITFAYRFKQGPYKECGTVFTESCSIGPKLSSIGVFYDDPNQVTPEKCRYAVGSILSEGEEEPNEDMLQLYQKFGFQVFSFPAVTHAVTVSFPHRTTLSIFLGVQRVYPLLKSYIKDRKLCAHPYLEIYKGDLIYYMSPLARQSDFYVPEVQAAERKHQDAEESEDDRGTDITGVDSNSEVSSVSHMIMSDSRETSLAPSTVPSMPPGEQEDEDNYGDQSSGESLDSSSSFEELNLDLQEGKDLSIDPEVKVPGGKVPTNPAVAEEEE
ncbi:testis-expressed protein 264 homolog isoform X1 [Brienomyrus brachyistius]|uniref:testis-expressed protein 264 homolog isoform X1 n=1 Tax=Brienomyrus brachyistius TaxID=42636 RepID=UPI0020B26342|nr:testis-expressed protein 264 homolog isoform X1 [Brienomyrus brachyistius]